MADAHLQELTPHSEFEELALPGPGPRRPRGTRIVLALVSVIALAALVLGARLYQQNQELAVQLETVNRTLSQQQTTLAQLSERSNTQQSRGGMGQWGLEQLQGMAGMPGPGRAPGQWSPPGGKAPQGPGANPPERGRGGPGRQTPGATPGPQGAPGADMSQVWGQAQRLAQMFQSGNTEQAGALLAKLGQQLAGASSPGKSGGRGKQPPRKAESRPQPGAGPRPQFPQRPGPLPAMPQLPNMDLNGILGALGGGRGPGALGRGGQRPDGTLLVENGRVAVRVDPGNGSFTIYDKLTRKTWRQVVPDQTFSVRSASREQRTFSGEVQAQVPCHLEVALDERTGDVTLTLEPKDIFAGEESREVALAYPYAFDQSTDGQLALPLKEREGFYVAPPLTGEWLHLGESLTGTWLALCSKTAGLVCLIEQPENWEAALRATPTGKDKAVRTVLAPTWRNQNGVVAGKLTVRYHVTSSVGYTQLQAAAEALAKAPAEREQ